MTATQVGCATQTRNKVTVKIVNDHLITDKARRILREILASAGLRSARVTSGGRQSADQARIMYENLQTHGVPHQKNLYGKTGDRVIDVYDANKAKPRADVIDLMKSKIDAIGCARVSNHCSNTIEAFDVAPSSLTDKKAFEKAAKAHGEVLNVLAPPADPAFHIEITR